MSEQKLAMIDGTYPSLMSGGVVATQGAKSDNLDDFKGSAYYGKSYYWPGGQTPSNAPSGANGGSLFLWRCGSSLTAQIFSTHRSSSGTTPPATYQRSQTSTNAWSDWEEIVTSDGSYPNLGAGHLQEIQINARSSDAVGWYKCGEFDVSRNTASGDLSCSVILQINGTNYGNYSESAINAAPSGHIEVDARITSGAFVNRYSSVGIISGNIASTDFCICSSSDGKKMNLYVNISHRYRDFKITKISEGQENVLSPNIFEFTDEYYGTSAPSNAIYGVVRNNASTAESDGDGNQISTTYAKQTGSYPTLGAGYLSRTNAIVTNGVGWYKLATLNVSALSTTAHNRTYSAIVDIQGVNPAGEIANNASSSRIEIDAVANTSGFDAQNTAIKVLSGYVDPSTLCAVTNTNEIVIYVYYGSLNRTFFTIVSEVWVTSHIEALQFTIDNTPITSAPSGAVYAVVRNIASYAESIPAASQTVLGGVKVYKDSEGYFCIDTQ